MLKVGQEEVDAVSRVIQSGNVFRYREDGECGEFAQSTNGTILANTGRHNYTEWDPILTRKFHKPSATTADITASQPLPLLGDLRGFQHTVARRPAERP